MIIDFEQPFYGNTMTTPHYNRKAMYDNEQFSRDTPNFPKPVSYTESNVTSLRQISPIRTVKLLNQQQVKQKQCKEMEEKFKRAF